MAAGAALVVLKMKASVISPVEQLAIVQYSDEHGVKAAADHFAVSQDRVCDCDRIVAGGSRYVRTLSANPDLPCPPQPALAGWLPITVLGGQRIDGIQNERWRVVDV